MQYLSALLNISHNISLISSLTNHKPIKTLQVDKTCQGCWLAVVALLFSYDRLLNIIYDDLSLTINSVFIKPQYLMTTHQSMAMGICA